ncbi:hypothetical protein QVD17_37449 [Tagetes erecta]|uniref:Uncharacterized protein n=1 Tax=Tagetes erecta TaxID=13708 RepID=A0AAD8JY97_TARER|nr:hypothetical protein QVD17_37449 [Tagetes erecta]
MLINESSNTKKHVSMDPTSMKPLPLLPTNYKFLTNSLPNSPRIGGVTPQHRPHSPLTCGSDTRLLRSKSGGEERSSVPYGGFDLWANLNNTAEHKSSKKHGSGTKMAKEVKKTSEMDFKCGALCLFMPGFGKGKPVRASRVQPQESKSQVVSNRISLEKFECGSWRSSAIHSDDDPSSALYFDLPLELIRTSVSDNALPMNSTFVFNNKGCVKGVLKTKGGPVERKSQDGRHVRFSTSSTTTQPTSPITPRLRKARDDFNAFLEAQSA